MELIYLLVK